MANITLTRADAGSFVTVNRGDMITVRLEENPTTGYVWKIEEIDPGVLELVSEEYETVAGGGIGGGGERKMVFRANAPDTSTLQLKCLRQWEPDNPLSTFSVTIEVHS
jgi:predicted secreted protein